MSRLRQVRSIAAMMRELGRKGLPIPDAPDLSLGERFSIILRQLPADCWERLLGRSVAHIRRYESDASQLPLSVAVALTDAAGVPLAWLAWGQQQPRRTGGRA